ncbi:MAG: HEPN domain-containing protein [Clostridia bacterium]|nr:HEPN domain-containing protein [Clostridia bacterium]
MPTRRKRVSALHDEERIALSKLRLENAKERLSFIPGILELGDYKTAANRAYYAVFYAMRAVLALDGFDSKKHSGIIAEFRKSYIKTGIFDEEMSDIISGLFNVRASSDYDDFYVISKEKVTEQYENAVRFIERVEAYLTAVYPN